MELLKAIKDVPSELLVALFCEKDYSGDPLCLAAFQHRMDNATCAECMKIIYNLPADQRTQVFLQCSERQGKSFAEVLFHACNYDSETLQAYFNSLNDLSEDQISKILMQKKMAQITTGMDLFRWCTNESVLNTLLGVCGKLKGEKLLQVLSVQDKFGWSMAMYLGKYCKSAAVFDKFFDLITNGLPPEKLAQFLSIKYFGNSSNFGLLLSQYCTIPEVHTKYFKVLNTLTDDQKTKILFAQDSFGYNYCMSFMHFRREPEAIFDEILKFMGDLSDDKLSEFLLIHTRDRRTIGMLFARYFKGPHFKKFTDIMNRLPKRQLKKVLNKQDSKGLTIGMYLAKYSSEGDTLTALFELMEKLDNDSKKKHLCLSNRNGGTFRDMLRKKHADDQIYTHFKKKFPSAPKHGSHHPRPHWPSWH
jgi:hypothetical protein